MESIHKVKYNVRDLSTRSVTLFLSRAQVFREIPNVPLKSGLNEITILGLSPTIDHQSVKVEGNGSAIISDITVEPTVVGESFLDVYPDSELDNDFSDTDDDEDEEPEVLESPELISARNEYRLLTDKRDQGKHLCATAEERRLTLQRYSTTLSAEHGVLIDEAMDTLQSARKSITEEYAKGVAVQREVEEDLAAAHTKLKALVKEHEREKKAVLKEYKRTLAEKKREKKKAARRKQERLDEKRRLRAEKQQFWPKYVYKVRIQLVVNTFTPAASRRDSMSSDFGVSAIDLASDEPNTKITGSGSSSTCNLVLSYVTTSAFWSPSYDLQLSTTNGSGRLCFDAKLHNATSETWDKCKVTLSTSQTVFGGVEEAAPTLTPWKIKLNKGGFGDGQPILKSRAELERKKHFRFEQKNFGIFKNRNDMFGFDKDAGLAEQGNNHALQDYQMQLMLLEQQNKKRLMMARKQVQGANNNNSNIAQTNNIQPQGPSLFGNSALQTTSAFGSVGFGSTNTNAGAVFGGGGGDTNTFGQAPNNIPSGGLFGAAAPQQDQIQQQQQQQQQMQQQQMQQQSAPQMPPPQLQASGFTNEINDFGEAVDSDDEGDDQLDYGESSVEESGFSTQYDLPGEKRLEPRNHESKQRVAQISFSHTVFNHTVVAKYKPVAYLSAKLTNSSKLTLLRGAVGVTLDGTFMGRTNLPRFVGGETISLGLGVDPAIKVHYALPEAKNATTGFFTKEQITIYDRVLRLENTRSSGAGAAIKLIAWDQIPVPSDDKVRVELLKPEGFVVGTDSTEGKAAGVPGRTRREDDKDWGTANAFLKKGGEVSWVVDLSPGKAVKLELQYLVGTPIGETALEV